MHGVDVLPVRFADICAGVGGFHAALSAFGCTCIYAVEIDRQAAQVYHWNWGIDPLGDLTKDATDEAMSVGEHEILVAGFPCQPFSKSGAQRGMDEARGTLFWNIANIIRVRKPKVVVLENVRNLAGPRHDHELDVIIQTLRGFGYQVADEPAIFSPHLLPKERGGRPQVRERVFITATLVPDSLKYDEALKLPVEPVARPTSRIDGFDPKQEWHLEDLLDDAHNIPGCDLSESEIWWIKAWDDFVDRVVKDRKGRHLPGFPIWADSWHDVNEAWECNVKRPDNWKPTIPAVDATLPAWKRSHLEKNYALFADNWKVIVEWANEWGVFTNRFPPSRRKLEWQAQDTPRLWDTVMHFRPSGIRAKKPTYLPALVAITQTSIVGPRRRRLSPRETARLQGLPDSFDFGPQSPAATYRQMGNGVNVGAVWHILREHVARDEWLLKEHGDIGAEIIRRILDAPKSPDGLLATHVPAGATLPKSGG